MSQPTTSATSYRFDNYYLDARNRQLWRDEQLLPLTSKYFDVLLLLVSNSGRLVEKQLIFDLVWNGVFVTDSALTQCIKDVRRQLGDDASNPRYIKTVPKHGYIFIGQAVASRVAPDLTAAEPAPDPAPRGAHDPPSLHSRPYKFLDYFTEQDAGLFFGREAEVEALRSQILAHRSFVLHGRSGVGKSSILRAGLMPRLRRVARLVVVAPACRRDAEHQRQQQDQYSLPPHTRLLPRPSTRRGHASRSPGSPAGPVWSGSREERDRLDVRRVREHVHRPHALEPVAELADELLRVAGERGRVARDVDEPRRPRARAIRRSALPDSPARGGSTTTTSGEPARSASSSTSRPTSPAKKAAFVIPFSVRVLDRAGDRLLRRPRCPHTVSASRASERPIVPIPQ